jgi:hypothetical protein
MTSRREFLQIGIAASAWPLAVRADLARGALAAPVPLYKVVYDTRFADSAAFGRSALAAGHSVHAIDGDMTRLWYDDLYHRWREAPVAIAGLTAHGALFCLERLAWDHGMRVVFRAEHAPSRDALVHELSGPADMLSAARASVCRADWAAGMADVVAACPAGRAAIESTRAHGPAVAAFGHDADSLWSWVIAPASRA